MFFLIVSLSEKNLITMPVHVKMLSPMGSYTKSSFESYNNYNILQNNFLYIPKPFQFY